MNNKCNNNNNNNKTKKRSPPFGSFFSGPRFLAWILNLGLRRGSLFCLIIIIIIITFIIHLLYTLAMSSLKCFYFQNFVFTNLKVV